MDKKETRKAIRKNFRKITQKDQPQHPKGYPIVANAVLTLVLWITTLTGGRYLGIPPQYIYAQVFNWSITMGIYAIISSRYKRLLTGHPLISFPIVFIIAYGVYILNCLYAFRVPYDNIIFLKALGGFMLSWASVNWLFATFDIRKTGFVNFSNQKKLPRIILIMLIGIITHHMYMWLVL